MIKITKNDTGYDEDDDDNETENRKKKLEGERRPEKIMKARGGRKKTVARRRQK
jgi:hypothetical protein